MLKTEDEYRQLWCPHVRHFFFGTPADPGIGDNRGNASPETNCIASACSQWRWAKPAGVEFASMIEAIKARRENTGGALKAAKEWAEANRDLWTSADERLGYCGLAGKPEPTS